LARIEKQVIINENRIVNGLWIGNELSLLELLTLVSFVTHGHEFQLWVYGELSTVIPAGVKLKDANQIIPESQVFRYKHSNQFGHGKGSVSGFSDIFRYKLLHDQGGWWVDMDVTCLKFLDFSEPYFFRAHHELTMVGNIMKCPKGSSLMLDCYNQAIVSVTEENQDWHKPIEILNASIERHQLSQYIRAEFSITDRWDMLRKYLYTTQSVPEESYFIHWMNEEWRSKGLDKYDFMIDSAYGQLLIKHSLVDSDFNSFSRLKNRCRFFLKRFAVA
jgi:hypothetical protein